MSMKYKIISIMISILVLSISVSAATTGNVVGVVIDKATGDPLIGATVMIQGKNIGGFTKLDGKFNLKNIPAGEYLIKISFVGYSPITVANVVVKENQVTTVNVALESESKMTEEVIVTASSLKDNEASLLKERQKSNTISDAISSELISKTSSSNVSEAMEKVTGVTIVDGKNIYIRGLGDRYMLTNLNGASLASSDPEKNSVATDIFSSKFVENIVTYKSFTPDKHGNFTGGMVDIRTKAFAETETFSLQLNGSYNSLGSFSNEYLTYQGGSFDWLGFDDGSRALPSILNQYEKIPSISDARYNKEQAQILNDISKAFVGQMSPEQGSSGMDQSWGISYGNQYDAGEHTFGIIAGLTFSNKFRSYSNGFNGQYNLTGKVSEVNELNALYSLSDSKGSMESSISGLLNLAYAPNEFNRISFNFMLNNAGEKVARYLHGYAQTLGDDYTTYETRTLAFNQRNVTSYQLNGEHHINELNKATFDWNLATNVSKSYDPNLRYFVNDYRPFEVDNEIVNVYSISASNYSEPSHYFRDLKEQVYETNLNLTLPVKIFEDLSTKFKVGGSVRLKDRDFNERIFKFRRESIIQYDGNPNTFFSDSLVGLIDYNENTGRNYFGNYITDQTQPANSYTGNENIYAYYGMFDFELTPQFRVIGGARIEMAKIDVKSKDSSKNYAIENGTQVELGVVNNNDILPTISFVYSMMQNMNLRLSFGRTLARPTFRELAPFPSFDYIGGYILNGNQKLKRTLIDNYDLRWEWFLRQGEIVAFSLFYKDFTNPIEMAILSTNNQIQYQNVPKATTYGLEAEYRVGLNFLSSVLNDFSFGGNLTFVHSKVNIPEKDFLTIKALDPDASNIRTMNGQSPYVVNVMLSYDNPIHDLHVNLYYNVFGKRLSKVSLGGTPNVFEYPRPILNFNVKYGVYAGFKVSLSIDNILNSDYIEALEYKGRNDYYVSRYSLGRTVSLGIGYDL